MRCGARRCRVRLLIFLAKVAQGKTVAYAGSGLLHYGCAWSKWFESDLYWGSIAVPHHIHRAPCEDRSLPSVRTANRAAASTTPHAWCLLRPGLETWSSLSSAPTGAPQRDRQREAHRELNAETECRRLRQYGCDRFPQFRSGIPCLQSDAD